MTNCLIGPQAHWVQYGFWTEVETLKGGRAVKCSVGRTRQERSIFDASMSDQPVLTGPDLWVNDGSMITNYDIISISNCTQSRLEDFKYLITRNPAISTKLQ